MCGCSEATSSSTRPTPDFWCRCCRRWCTCAEADRLTTLTRLLGEEAREHRPGRDLLLSRLVEVLLIEALRALQGEDTPPGLLRGLADTRVSAAIRRMHGDPARPWTVVELAREAALSRSAFFDRFMRIVGVPPMAYLLAWRMAVAKDLLRRRDVTLSEVAERVGYSSASTFSTAFSRYVGQAPGGYARALASWRGGGMPATRRLAPFDCWRRMLRVGSKCCVGNLSRVGLNNAGLWRHFTRPQTESCPQAPPSPASSSLAWPSEGPSLPIEPCDGNRRSAGVCRTILWSGNRTWETPIS